MNALDDFYVGYVPTLSPSIRKAVVRWLIVTASVTVTLAVCLVVFQNELNDHQYHPTAELRSKKLCCSVHRSSDGHGRGIDGQLSGYLVSKPVPMLRIPVEGRSTYDVLLVAAGKFGFRPSLQRWAQENGKQAEGSWVCVRGNLIYGKGRSLIEIEHLSDIVACSDSLSTVSPSAFDLSAARTEELVGEVIDPKCYLGVMKPGESTTHRACAIRCISGGIPPVLRVLDDGGEKFYLLLGPQGQDIRHSVLPHVASLVKVSGRVESASGWGVVYADSASFRTLE